MKLKGKTEKAFILEIDGLKQIVPISQCWIEGKTLIIKDWIANQKGIGTRYRISDSDFEAYFGKNQPVLSFPRNYILENCSDVYTPNEVQIQALEKSGLRSGFGLFLRQGLGKTKLCLDEIHLALKENINIDLVIVVCPNNVKRVWMDEIWNLFLSKDQFDYYKYDSSKKKINKYQRDYFLSSQKKKFLVMNYEAFVSKQGTKFVEVLLDKYKDVYLILDECHKISNRKSKRGEWFRENASRFQYRRALSGTPFKNNLTEAWNIFKFIHPNLIQLKYWDFIKTYFHYSVNHFNQWEIGDIKQAKLPTLKNIIDSHYLEAKDTDYLDLPEAIPNTVYAELESDIEKEYIETVEEMYGINFDTIPRPEDCTDKPLQILYNLIKEEGIKPLKEKEHLLQRLMQLGNGYRGNREDHYFIRKDGSCSKIDELQSLLEMYDFTEQQVVIVGTAIPLLLKTAETCRGYASTGYIDGKIEQLQREDIIADFKQGKHRILVSNTTCIATGENLQCCNNMIFMNLDFRADEFDQVGKRIHRQGQKKTCYYTFIVGEGTIDEVIKDVVERKLKNQDVLLRDTTQQVLDLYK